MTPTKYFASEPKIIEYDENLSEKVLPYQSQIEDTLDISKDCDKTKQQVSENENDNEEFINMETDGNTVGDYDSNRKNRGNIIIGDNENSVEILDIDDSPTLRHYDNDVKGQLLDTPTLGEFIENEDVKALSGEEQEVIKVLDYEQEKRVNEEEKSPANVKVPQENSVENGTISAEGTGDQSYYEKL